MSGLQIRNSAGERHCGACTACCTYLPLPHEAIGLNTRPVREPCPRVGTLGCRRHARRPRACADFACAWLSDPLWPKAWRPDGSGLLCVREAIDGHRQAAVIFEIQPGALTTQVGNDLVSHLLQTTVALAIVDAHGRRLGLDAIRAA